MQKLILVLILTILLPCILIADDYSDSTEDAFNIIIEDGSFELLQEKYGIHIVINDETADDPEISKFLNFCLTRLAEWEEKKIEISGFPVEYFEEYLDKDIEYGITAFSVVIKGSQWIKYSRHSYFSDYEIPPEKKVNRLFHPIELYNDPYEDQQISSIIINGDKVKVYFNNGNYDIYVFTKMALDETNEGYIKGWEDSWVDRREFRLSYDFKEMLETNNAFLIPYSDRKTDLFEVRKIEDTTDDTFEETDLFNDSIVLGRIPVTDNINWKRDIKYLITGPLVEVDEEGFLMLNGKHIVDSTNNYFRAEEANVDLINRTLVKGEVNYLLILGTTIFYLKETPEVIIASEEFNR